MAVDKVRFLGAPLLVNAATTDGSGKEVHMVDSNKTYKVLRTLPRRGETYAVKLRSGITEIRVAARDFRRDKRRTFVPQDAA